PSVLKDLRTVNQGKKSDEAENRDRNFRSARYIGPQYNRTNYDGERDERELRSDVEKKKEQRKRGDYEKKDVILQPGRVTIRHQGHNWSGKSYSFDCPC